MKKLGEAIGKFVVKHKILIVIASVILCIPSLFGYINTDINYDILVYLYDFVYVLIMLQLSLSSLIMLEKHFVFRRY